MSEREQVIDRIKKLLAHSVENGATEAEAIAFALKAQRLIADNDIEEWEFGESGKQEVIEVTSERSYVRTWRALLAVALADNFRCKAIATSKCTGGSKRRKSFITFIGYECDAKAALMVFEHLYKVGDELGKKHSKRYPAHRDAYENFVRGFVTGVRTELEKQCEALMLVRPREVEEHVKEMKLGKARPLRAIFMDEQSLEAGREAGRDAVRARRLADSVPPKELAMA